MIFHEFLYEFIARTLLGRPESIVFDEIMPDILDKKHARYHGFGLFS